METKIGEFEATERDGYPNLKGRRDDLDEIRKDREGERDRRNNREKEQRGIKQEIKNNIERHVHRERKDI